MSRRIDAKPDTCTERRDVDPTGISVKVSAQYPGRYGGLPLGYRRRVADQAFDFALGRASELAVKQVVALQFRKRAGLLAIFAAQNPGSPATGLRRWGGESWPPRSWCCRRECVSVHNRNMRRRKRDLREMPLCILTAAFCLRNLAQGNSARQRSIVVESSAYRSRTSLMPVASSA